MARSPAAPAGTGCLVRTAGQFAFVIVMSSRVTKFSARLTLVFAVNQMTPNCSSGEIASFTETAARPERSRAFQLSSCGW